jgi:translation initiation factor IF-2
MRVHELAKKLNSSSKVVIEKLQELGVDAKNHMSKLDEETVHLFLELEGAEQAPETLEVEKAVEEEEEILETYLPAEKPKHRKELSAKKAGQKVIKKSPQVQPLPSLSEGTTETLPPGSTINLYEAVSVKELADKLGQRAHNVIKELMKLGKMFSVNHLMDLELAEKVAKAFGVKVQVKQPTEQPKVKKVTPKPTIKEKEKLVSRAPVVTIMGHVDHGKTSLLDAIRHSNIVKGEYGGITQHIGAYKVKTDKGEIVFLDTPGHEAFTAMRMRGASVTDIVILVVAADEGVKPQTVEAIHHAREANVPIVVAVNKIDKPDANIDRVKKELGDYDLIPEDWGGNSIFVNVSAQTQENLSDLLEMILLEAEMLELKTNPDIPAIGTVIESKLDRGRGPVPTVLVQNGCLKVGDPIVSGKYYGKVRALIDDKGKSAPKAYASTPVEVLGLSGIPDAGDMLKKEKSEKEAYQISQLRFQEEREKHLSARTRLTLEDLHQQITEGIVKDLKVIIKGDVQGSVQAVKESLEKLSTEKVKILSIHDAVGAITETDVMLASASNALIIGFNVRPEAKAKKTAEKEKVDIRLYTVIYNLIDDVRAAMEGLLEPVYEEKVVGRAEVREIYNIPKVGTVAGCFVSEGKVSRGGKIRVLRDNVVINTSTTASLRRFKEDTKEVATGYECGIRVENFNDVKQGDVIEAFVLEEIAVKL